MRIKDYLNQPHWKDIKTFPYHKYEQNKIFPSHRVNIAEVIEEIKAGIASEFRS